MCLFKVAKYSQYFSQLWHSLIQCVEELPSSEVWFNQFVLTVVTWKRRETQTIREGRLENKQSSHCVTLLTYMRAAAIMCGCVLMKYL